MIFPGSCEMMTFPQFFSSDCDIARNSSVHNFLYSIICKCFLENTFTLIVHVSFLFPQCLYLISFCYPLALSFYTLPHSTKYVQDTNTHLEITCNSEKQELRYIPTLVFHISYQNGAVRGKKLN